jgi:AmmeMemoRadiSam system protein A
MDQYTALAREAIKHFFKTKEVLVPPKNLPEAMKKTKAGVFVSLHTKSNHSLRGCIGTWQPTGNNIAEEICQNALSAAFEDPRFPPLSEKELDDLEIKVDVLSESEQIEDKTALNPKKYGLIVSNQNGRQGLLLPDIGIDSVEEQIAICCQKGGINPQTDRLTFLRFTVKRHS